MVDDAETGPPDDRGVVHVVGQPFDELFALPHAVQPVRVAAVAAAYMNRHRQLGLDIEVHRGAVRCGGAGGAARAGPEVEVPPRAAELFDAAVAPDPGAVVERAKPVGLLLDDQY